MPMGPGKYDNLATMVREKANAAAVIVIVFEGDKGSGFSCQARADSALAIHMHLPDLLEGMAREIRQVLSAQEDG